MKHALRALALAAVVSLIASAPVFAEGLQVMAKVPFAFTASDKAFPAGDYNFIVDDPTVPTMITVESKDGSRYDIMLGEATQLPEAARESKVVFDRYGDQHYLAQVYVAGMGVAVTVPAKEIQQEMAQGTMQHKKVEVPARKK